jgi:glycosyltransferase involved in cell wall biosynthesis
MPAPLVDGEHILYVEDDQEAMREAVARIVGDDRIRTRLELGARRYYLEYLSPERVVQRLAFGS